MLIREKLSRFIIDYSETNHLTRNQFAAKTGISRSSLRQYINCLAEPTLETLYCITVFTGVDMFDYLDISKPKKRTSSDKIKECITALENIDARLNDCNKSALNVVYEPSERPVQISCALPDNVRNYLYVNNMKSCDFADQIGVHKSKVTSYVNGHSLPSLNTALKMCDVMGVSMQELLGLEITEINELDIILERLRAIEKHLD